MEAQRELGARLCAGTRDLRVDARVVGLPRGHRTHDLGRDGVAPARSPRVGGGGHEFLPVKIVVAGEAETPRVEAEIVLVGGRRVRVAGALTFEQLAQLLQVVEGGGVC